jgi:hypothetical protein
VAHVYTEDYACADPGYSEWPDLTTSVPARTETITTNGMRPNVPADCDYYDYGVNIEGTGTLGILANLMLDQINRLANLTPRIAARARVVTAASGLEASSRRNTTVVVQVRCCDCCRRRKIPLVA